MNEERNDLRSFEVSFEELEELVRRLESGALTLDESLAHYEKGVLSLRRCYKILEVAEKRLELLVKDGEGGVTTRAVDLNELRGEARGGAKVAIAGAAVVASESGKVAAVAVTAFAAGLEGPTPAPTAAPQVVHAPQAAPQPVAPRAQRAPASGERPAATSGRAAIQAPGATPAAPKTGKQPQQGGGGGASLFGDA